MTRKKGMLLSGLLVTTAMRVAALRTFGSADAIVAFVVASVLLMLSGCASGPETVVPWAGAEQRGGTEVSQWALFCLREAAECEPASGPAIVPFDVAAQVNERINSAVVYVEDQRHFGQLDYWTTVKDGMGDCEDYALTKRQALRRLGYGSDSMSVVSIAYNGGAADHAALLVRTERGDMILDNMVSEPYAPSEGMKIASIEQRGHWYPVSHVARRGK